MKQNNPNIVYLTHEEMVNDLAPAIGRKIKKIGMDIYHNTCRIVLDDGQVIFLQSVAGESYLLKHGICSSMESGERAKMLENATSMTWANDLAHRHGGHTENSETRAEASRPPCSVQRLVRSRKLDIWGWLWIGIFIFVLYAIFGPQSTLWTEGVCGKSKSKLQQSEMQNR